jgi:hypothetical protein
VIRFAFRIIVLSLQLIWVTLRSRESSTLQIMEKMMEVQTDALHAAVLALINKDHADEAAAQAAKDAGDAAIGKAQTLIDGITAEIVTATGPAVVETGTPPPPPPPPAPAAPAADPAAPAADPAAPAADPAAPASGTGPTT